MANPIPPTQQPPPAYSDPSQPVPTAAPVPEAESQVVFVPTQAPANQSAPIAAEGTDSQGTPQIFVYSHSTLFYWWPVWVVGYVMALLTYLDGQQHQQAVAFWEWIHPNSNLGVSFFVTLFLVIMITNVAVRGLASVIVILSVVLATVLLAYFNMWDEVLSWIGGLKVHLNLGAYAFISTLLLIVWVGTVFIFDRMSFWRIRPGQITHEFILGAASRSYDTENMVLEKFRDDLFRHWFLGLGSGDLHIKPYGADREQIEVPNVLFVGTKVEAIQRMIATQPQAFGHVVLK